MHSPVPVFQLNSEQLILFRKFHSVEKQITLPRTHKQAHVAVWNVNSKYNTKKEKVAYIVKQGDLTTWEEPVYFQQHQNWTALSSN